MLIFITSPTHEHRALDYAYHLQKNSVPFCLFFYGDGTRLAHQNHDNASWRALGMDLPVCVQGANARGVNDDTLAQGFSLVGLGAALTQKHWVQF